MHVFELVIALLVGGAVLAALARRIGAPYPALVALAGAALALVPGVPLVQLDPELALALFVAPVLVDAAFDTSTRDLRANWRVVAGLALGAVALTIAAVAVVAKLLVPDMPWAVAIALGAIVAPPDAAAATTVLKQLKPPHRLLVILEGESLFNDASALLVYRLAVGAAVVGALSGGEVLPALLLATVGSVALAYGFYLVIPWIINRIDDVATSVIFQFAGAFFVWIAAERLHLSGIITCVVFAMLAARNAPERMPARLRLPSWAVWEVAVFVLNVLAFILVGIQLKAIAARVTGDEAARFAIVAGAVCIAVILARFAWVSAAAAFSRWLCRPGPEGTRTRHDVVALDRKSAALVGWCGMRGTVTLAAALALPLTVEDGAPFPYRDLVLVTAFGVVLGTLVLQGLTLRPLIARLGIEDDGTLEREVRHARVESMRAAAQAARESPDGDTARLVRTRYEFQLRRAEDGARSDGALAADSAADAEVVRAATGAARQRLVALRTDRTIGDAAFQQIQEELDWAEQDWAQLLRGAGEADAADDGSAR